MPRWRLGLIPVLGLALGLAWHLPSPLAQGPGVSGKQSPSAPVNSKIVHSFKEENWVFDIQNGNIRFSHGNHKNRDRWFRAYFRKNYECGICHNTSLPVDDRQGGITLSPGDPLQDVEEIRAAADDPYTYGVKMLTCLNACHNGFTAPKECAWCHLPESKPIREGQKEITKW